MSSSGMCVCVLASLLFVWFHPRLLDVRTPVPKSRLRYRYVDIALDPLCVFQTSVIFINQLNDLIEFCSQVSKVLLQQIESGKLVNHSDLSEEDVGQLETILNTSLHSFLSVPILHKHQDRTRILKRRRTSSIFYEPEKDLSAGTLASHYHYQSLSFSKIFIL